MQFSTTYTVLFDGNLALWTAKYGAFDEMLIESFLLASQMFKFAFGLSSHLLVFFTLLGFELSQCFSVLFSGLR